MMKKSNYKLDLAQSQANNHRKSVKMKKVKQKSEVTAKPQFNLTESGRNRLVKRYEQRPASLGRTHQLRHIHAEKLTRQEAILAKCFTCDRFQIDGHKICPMPACSLHPFVQQKSRVTK